ncbi:MAG: uracil-DNA glycosylase [Pseudomonadota bacterium]
MKTEPHPNCRRCPRLSRYIGKFRRAEPEWHNAPVPTWMPQQGVDAVKVLIIGLAPGLRGANRTGRAFTGDAAGELLHPTLLKFGFAKGQFHNMPDDGMELVDCAITNAVRCVPPENKPTGTEINNCRKFLSATIKQFSNLESIITLGKIAHDSTLRALEMRVADYPFAHNEKYEIESISVVSSYHCSRYNVNTGRLTQKMFEDVFSELRSSQD